MLISHKKRFIYTKTLKTASTSIEIFFQSECLPDAFKNNEEEATDEKFFEEGIVGYRGPDPKNVTFYNHMPLSEIQYLIGTEKFEKYYKFCAIRNPFDKMVSAWWWTLPRPQRERMAQTDFQIVKNSFSNWIMAGDWTLGGFSYLDRNKYFIGDRMVMDRFIRYENMHADVQFICDKLHIDKTADSIGRHKGNIRNNTMHFSEYYTKAEKNKIQESFNWEINYFGYHLYD